MKKRCLDLFYSSSEWRVQGNLQMMLIIPLLNRMISNIDKSSLSLNCGRWHLPSMLNTSQKDLSDRAQASPEDQSLPPGLRCQTAACRHSVCTSAESQQYTLPGTRLKPSRPASICEPQMAHQYNQIIQHSCLLKLKRSHRSLRYAFSRSCENQQLSQLMHAIWALHLPHL